jgi:hypothetical protein
MMMRHDTAGMQNERQQRANLRAQVETAATVAAPRAVNDPRMVNGSKSTVVMVASPCGGVRLESCSNDGQECPSYHRAAILKTAP